MVSIKLCKIGNSLGITFPKELLEELNIKEDDEFHILKTEKGLELVPYTSDFIAETEAYRYAIKNNRNALRRLAR